MTPSIRVFGGESTARWRSEPPLASMSVSSVSSSFIDQILFFGEGGRLGVTFRIKHILSGDFGSDLALVEQCLHGIVHGEHAELLAGLHGIF